MQSKVKLSPAMKEVIELMRKGYFIYAGMNYAKVSKTHLSYTYKRINYKTLDSLHGRGLVTSNRIVNAYLIFNLTELGKTVII